MKREKKIKELAKILNYGLEWLEDYDTDREVAFETLGHIASCFCYQNFGENFGGTGDAVDYLELRDFPQEGRLIKLLDEIIVNEKH